jgi:recombinational DNA repair ATPase RecF
MQHLIAVKPKYEKAILSLRYLVQRKNRMLVKTSDDPRELVDDFNSNMSEEEFAQKLITAREKAPKAVEYLLRLIKKQVFTDE